MKILVEAQPFHEPDLILRVLSLTDADTPVPDLIPSFLLSRKHTPKAYARASLWLGRIVDITDAQWAELLSLDS
jgi:hypothetical protein